MKQIGPEEWEFGYEDLSDDIFDELFALLYSSLSVQTHTGKVCGPESLN